MVVRFRGAIAGGSAGESLDIAAASSLHASLDVRFDGTPAAETVVSLFSVTHGSHVLAVMYGGDDQIGVAEILKDANGGGAASPHTLQKVAAGAWHHIDLRLSAKSAKVSLTVDKVKVSVDEPLVYPLDASAEQKVLSGAARLGASTSDCTIYFDNMTVHAF